MLNLIIPLLKGSEEFSDAGYDQPHSFIPVGGSPVVAMLADNLAPKPKPAFRRVFTVRADILDDDRKRFLTEALDGMIVEVAPEIEGIASAAVRAIRRLDAEEPVAVATPYQLLNCEVAPFYKACAESDLDGMIVTFPGQGAPRWEYSLVYRERVVEVADDRVISQHANAGLYYLRRGQTLLDHAESVRRERPWGAGMLDMAPVLNRAIESGTMIGHYAIESSAVMPVETLADLQRFILTLDDRPGLAA